MNACAQLGGKSRESLQKKKPARQAKSRKLETRGQDTAGLNGGKIGGRLTYRWGLRKSVEQAVRGLRTGPLVEIASGHRGEGQKQGRAGGTSSCGQDEREATGTGGMQRGKK